MGWWGSGTILRVPDPRLSSGGQTDRRTGRGKCRTVQRQSWHSPEGTDTHLGVGRVGSVKRVVRGR